MTQTELFGKALWVSPDGKCDTPYIRGEFGLKENVRSASIVICGLGFFELYLNGKRVGDAKFDPVNSDFHFYEKQHCYEAYGETTGHRIYAVRHDVTDLLSEHNCIGVLLAPGWYKNEFCAPYGEVKLCFRLTVTYEDGTSDEIVSGDWLTYTQSPIVRYSFHFGETQDHVSVRLGGWNEVGKAPGKWDPLTVIPAPETAFYVQDCPSDKIIRTLAPVRIGETESAYIYDVGENISGTPVVRTVTGGTQTVEVVCSERLDETGMIEEYTTHGQKSTFITDDPTRECALRMTWYAFRYVSVTKNAELVRADVIHADVPVTSTFSCDVPVLNWLYKTYLRTQLDNMHSGIPSDCPHLERLGYTGDGELVCECGMTMLDSRRFYRKWIDDIFDCQDTKSGHVQYTAPYFHAGGGPGGWGCAIIEVPYTYYKVFGDSDVLPEALERALKYFDYLDAHSEDGVVTSDQPGLWCLGDWCTPTAIEIPQPYVNTYFYIKSLGRAIEAAEVVGRADLVPALRARRDAKIKALRAHFYDPETGDYANNIQGADAFAVDLGIADERTVDNLIRHYENDPHYDTGIFGTDIVTRTLFERGRADLAFKLLTSDGPYSFTNWMNSGCTTLPEYWTFKRSQNHPMFGAVTKYLFRYLLGIVPLAPAYKTVRIDPRFTDGLNRASGSLLTASGRIGVSFVRENGKTALTVTVPEGMNVVTAAGMTLKSGENTLIL